MGIIGKEMVKIMNIYTCFCIFHANSASQVKNVVCDYLGRSAFYGEPWQLNQDLNFLWDELSLSTILNTLYTPADYLYKICIISFIINSN